jgi:hypothetical protein
VTQAKRAATPEPQEPGLDAGTVTFRDAVATARVGGDRVAPGVEQEDYGSPRCGGYRLDMTAEHRLADQMLRSTRFALLVVAAIVLRGQVWGSLSPRRRPHRDRPRGGRYRKHRRRAGIRPADQYGAPCMQPTVTRGGRPGGSAPETSPSEDCLYLNVWTAAASTSERRPVIVWSHGGAFTIGSGSGRDGDALARKGVVVVAHLAATRIV